MKGFTLGLALKQGQKTTWKSPIYKFLTTTFLLVFLQWEDMERYPIVEQATKFVHMLASVVQPLTG